MEDGIANNLKRPKITASIGTKFTLPLSSL